MFSKEGAAVVYKEGVAMVSREVVAVVSKEGVGRGCGLQGGCRVWLWSPRRV